MQELDYAKIGMRIRQLRKARGWSQEELARKSGISMSFLGHIERGSRIMSMETFASICRVLEANADGLLWGVAYPSGALADVWAAADKSAKQHQTDGYAMYVRIMKSVAEIVNEA